MCGSCCTTDPLEFKNKYKEKNKGICKAHEHMLIYSNFYWREYEGEGFICNICNTKMNNNGSFHCRRCKYTLCPKCFYDLGGEISNDFQVNQKGRIDKHKHILNYIDLNKRNIPASNYPTFKCRLCKGFFMMEDAESWNCERCGYDICDKCFIENGGKIIQ